MKSITIIPFHSYLYEGCSLFLPNLFLYRIQCTLFLPQCQTLFKGNTANIKAIPKISPALCSLLVNDAILLTVVDFMEVYFLSILWKLLYSNYKCHVFFIITCVQFYLDEYVDAFYANLQNDNELYANELVLSLLLNEFILIQHCRFFSLICPVKLNEWL